jgi:small subunit ribosomal protein S21
MKDTNKNRFYKNSKKNQNANSNVEFCRAKVIVENNNLNKALMNLKKRLKDFGVIKELRDRMFYEKPSEKRRKIVQSAIIRQNKKNRQIMLD